MLLEELNITSDATATLIPATAATGFNYAALTSAEARKARKAADAIRASIKNAQQSYMDAGRELVAIKDAIPHGEFGKWLDAEFGMSVRTAQNYMNAFKLWQENETVSDLSPKAIYALAAPSTPLDVKKGILDRIKSGEVPSGNSIITEITAAKRKAAEEAEKAKAEANLKTEAERNAAAKKEKASADYKAKKAKREAEERAESERRRAALKQTAASAVVMLQDKLGTDLLKFYQFFKRADIWDFTNCLEEAVARTASPGPLVRLRDEVSFAEGMDELCVAVQDVKAVEESPAVSDATTLRDEPAELDELAELLEGLVIDDDERQSA